MAETGEMVQQLRTLAALPGDPGSIPSTHMHGSLHLSVTPISRDLTPAQTYMQQNTNEHKNKLFFKKDRNGSL